MKKSFVSRESLWTVLDLLDGMGMRYWVDGGWGVDILIGKEHRPHRDVDISADGGFTAPLLARLKETGYRVTADWLPVRLELHHPTLGYLDVHPLIIEEDGSAKQAGLFGKWYHFEAGWFTRAMFEGRSIPCLTAEAQIFFHTGYRLRPVDKVDMEHLRCFMTEV